MILPEPNRILPVELDGEIHRRIMADRIRLIHVTDRRARSLQPGDMLWVREALTFPGSTREDDWIDVIYGADGRKSRIRWPRVIARPVAQWIPPAGMPIHASRLTLVVERAAEMRLQQIGEEQAVQAGIDVERDGYHNPLVIGAVGSRHLDPVEAFGCMWNCLRTTNIFNGEAWEDNPEVMEIRFRAHARGVADLVPGVGTGGAR